MANSYGHGWELLYKGTRMLATHPSSIKERLIWAFSYELHLLSQEELDPETWERFSRVFQEVTSEPDTTGAGTIPASINKMSDNRASEIAGEIFDIFDDHSKTYRGTS